MAAAGSWLCRPCRRPGAALARGLHPAPRLLLSSGTEHGRSAERAAEAAAFLVSSGGLAGTTEPPPSGMRRGGWERLLLCESRAVVSPAPRGRRAPGLRVGLRSLQPSAPRGPSSRGPQRRASRSARRARPTNLQEPPTVLRRGCLGYSVEVVTIQLVRSPRRCAQRRRYDEGSEDRQGRREHTGEASRSAQRGRPPLSRGDQSATRASEEGICTSSLRSPPSSFSGLRALRCGVRRCWAGVRTFHPGGSAAQPIGGGWGWEPRSYK